MTGMNVMGQLAHTDAKIATSDAVAIEATLYGFTVSDSTTRSST